MSSSHGMTGTRLYRIWSNMKTRCYNKLRAVGRPGYHRVP